MPDRSLVRSANEDQLTRRTLLQSLGALGTFAVAGRALAAGPSRAPLVVVILRGGLDGLAAVPPVGDPAYHRLRQDLAIEGLPLTGDFALHPSLVFLHEQWTAGTLGILHAASSPYRARSHFDGQDVLERGDVSGPDAGWLSRALERRGSAGLGVGPMLPLLLRGPGAATSWTPSRMGPPRDDLLARLGDLYAPNPVLRGELETAMATSALVPEDTPAGRDEAFLGSAAMLASPEGPEAAVISLTGFDTHANQGTTGGGLAGRLGGLDAALRVLHGALGTAWASTRVMVVTEFGRTVRPNGTRGTDHGMGAAAFVLGGAVAGRRMLGEWPTLSKLYEDRDLYPANDVRSLFAGVLAHHWGIEDLFPGVSPLERV